VYTLGAIHKLYTSQLIAVMVKGEKVKSVKKRVNRKKVANHHVFSITSFTEKQNNKKVSVLA
jgi:hypothetical protein